MPTEEQPVDEQLEQPRAAGEPVPNPAPVVADEPEAPPVDLAAALAKQRAELEAETVARIGTARAEAAEQALASERARLTEEQRLAALTETERLAEQHRVTEAENKRLADELATSKAATAASEQKLSIVAAMADTGVRLPRNEDGTTDAKLEALVLDEVRAKLGAGMAIAAAIAELQATKPWMFQRPTAAEPEAPKPTTTTGGRGAAPGRTLPPRSPAAPDVRSMSDEEWQKTKRRLGIVY
jgi:hypothetical protein